MVGAFSAPWQRRTNLRHCARSRIASSCRMSLRQIILAVIGMSPRQMILAVVVGVLLAVLVLWLAPDLLR